MRDRRMLRGHGDTCILACCSEELRGCVEEQMRDDKMQCQPKSSVFVRRVAAGMVSQMYHAVSGSMLRADKT